VKILKRGDRLNIQNVLARINGTPVPVPAPVRYSAHEVKSARKVLERIRINGSDVNRVVSIIQVPENIRER